MTAASRLTLWPDGRSLGFDERSPLPALVNASTYYESRVAQFLVKAKLTARIQRRFEDRRAALRVRHQQRYMGASRRMPDRLRSFGHIPLNGIEPLTRCYYAPMGDMGPHFGRGRVSAPSLQR